MHSDTLASVFDPTRCGTKLAEADNSGDTNTSELAHDCNTTMVQEAATVHDTRAGTHSGEAGQDKDA